MSLRVLRNLDERLALGVPPLYPLRGREHRGRVFTFESQEDLEQVREHYEGFGGPFFSYVYVEGNVLVQLPGEVPEDQADRYGEVLQEM